MNAKHSDSDRDSLVKLRNASGRTLTVSPVAARAMMSTGAYENLGPVSLAAREDVGEDAVEEKDETGSRLRPVKEAEAASEPRESGAGRASSKRKRASEKRAGTEEGSESESGTEGDKE